MEDNHQIGKSLRVGVCLLCFSTLYKVVGAPDNTHDTYHFWNKGAQFWHNRCDICGFEPLFPHDVRIFEVPEEVVILMKMLT